MGALSRASHRAIQRKLVADDEQGGNALGKHATNARPSGSAKRGGAACFIAAKHE
jgi:hypothetical protein